MAVKRFDHNDPGFKRWLREHPRGYVLNCYRTGRVHRADCPSYRSAGPHMTHTRAKACSTSERELFEYAEQRGFDVLRCARCWEDM
jgi:hypothetical protein